MPEQSTASLLEIIRDVRGVDIGITWARSKKKGDRVWILDAQSGDGQLWRVQHTDLLAAASVLSDLLIAASVQTKDDEKPQHGS